MTDRLTREEMDAELRRVRQARRRAEQWRPPPLGTAARVAHLLPPERRRPLRFVARTETASRSGTAVDVTGVRLDAFGRNPVVLFNHDGERLPVGRGDAFVVDRELLVDVTFDRRDRLARRIEGKYRRGFLHAVSVSLELLDYGGEDGNIVVTDSELLEVSVVTVPDDRWAVTYQGGRR